MADQETVTISIFDKDYKINCGQEEVQALRDSAHYLDKKMREIKTARTVMGFGPYCSHGCAQHCQ